ncbi:MAG: PilZ domain-containing protein [Magnetococcales bacterium]|nr:PilZ domain-containing protein [Magnetococcales bacterium]
MNESFLELQRLVTKPVDRRSQKEADRRNDIEQRFLLEQRAREQREQERRNKSAERRGESPRRRFPREMFKTSLVYKNGRGVRVSGTTKNVSICGVMMELSEINSRITSGEQGMLLLVEQKGEHAFPCQVIRNEENKLILEISRDHISQFGAVLTASIFSSLQQELNLVDKWENGNK